MSIGLLASPKLQQEKYKHDPSYFLPTSIREITSVSLFLRVYIRRNTVSILDFEVDKYYILFFNTSQLITLPLHSNNYHSH